MTVLVRLPGVSPYGPVARLQDRLVDLRGAGAIPDTVLLLTHEETITLGRMATDGAVVDGRGVEVVEVARGGEATWHGPGQLVAYPIVRLAGPHKDVHGALAALEQAVIDELAVLGVQGTRDSRNTGVWVDGRKVCSIGIGLRRWVVRHGLALNLDADLGGFGRIRPCGFDADVMTRLADHVDVLPDLDALADAIGGRVASGLGGTAGERVTYPCRDDDDGEAIVRILTGIAAAEDAP